MNTRIKKEEENLLYYQYVNNNDRSKEAVTVALKYLEEDISKEMKKNNNLYELNKERDELLSLLKGE
jgi:hypothetical protein